VAFLRNHPRTTDTHDLSVQLRLQGRRLTPRHVLNLSPDGMLVSGGDLDVGATTAFELDGDALHATGEAEVTHCADDSVGLRVVRWEGASEHEIQDLVGERLRKQRLYDAAHVAPGAFLG
jgi:hypothetical protein